MKKEIEIKVYFEFKGYKVVDFPRKSFANYTITNKHGVGIGRAFDSLEEAILYCIGISTGKLGDQRLCFLIETFITMINK